MFLSTSVFFVHLCGRNDGCCACCVTLATYLGVVKGLYECGNATDVGTCAGVPCPVDCVLSEWSAPTDCSQTCGGGVRYRTVRRLRDAVLDVC